VVLNTDGVTEARNGNSFFGETGIAEVLDAGAGQTSRLLITSYVIWRG
jgi:serine phosphatase RsbU (regulator of sigma subunit)